MKLRIGRLFAAMLPLLLIGEIAKAEFLLTDNDRVVLFSDSSFGHSFAPEWFCQFVRTRYPDLNLEFYSLARSRSDAADGLKRLAVEVLPLKPTWVIVSFGLDAPARQAFRQERLTAYVRDMSTMIDSIKASGAKILVFTPPPPQESKHKSLQAAHFNDVVAKYADALRELAKAKDVEILDWHKVGLQYKSKLGDGPNVHWTKRGLQPMGLSLSVAIDLLLTRLQAEPLNYMVEVDWDTENASASSGSVKVTKHTKKSMTLELKDVPVTLDMNARGKLQTRSWPLSNWCKLVMKINNMPPGGVIVSPVKGKGGKPFLQTQFEVGADMSQIGPLARNASVSALHNIIRTKLGQCSKYTDSMGRTVPEPELEEGYRLYREADTQLMIATQKIENRTPARYDTTIKIEYAPKSPRKKAAQKRPGQNKAGSKKGSRPRRGPHKPVKKGN
ncbi:MAG: hypothetical protein GXP29_07365 [Planctomycetes bacterium]|nr:hypothetical protein [Planctomycetota bacterium]